MKIADFIVVTGGSPATVTKTLNLDNLAVMEADADPANTKITFVGGTEVTVQGAYHDVKAKLA